jgi:hypothetical protein
MESDPAESRAQQPPPLGGLVHSYQKYDPKNFPSPTAEPPDLASAAMNQMLMYGDMRELTEEELNELRGMESRERVDVGLFHKGTTKTTCKFHHKTTRR